MLTDITRTVFTVSDFLDWQRSGTLQLSPSFQRRPVWSVSAKSYLVDTIVKGLPIPIIFIRMRTDRKSLRPKREVVDGQQRLRTVLGFIDPDCLCDFDPTKDAFTVSKQHNADMAGRPFAELEEEFRTRIADYQFSVHVLPPGTDDAEVLQIFSRMNATGVKLNPQELRNANFFGAFKQCMYTLAYEQLERWRNFQVFKENQIARMQEVELTSEFAQLMYDGIVGKQSAALNRLYNKHEDKFEDQSQVSRRFRKVMDTIDNLLGKDLAELPLKRIPLFYDLFALVYDVSFGLHSPLTRKAARKPPPGMRQGLLRASARIADKDVSQEVAEALARRTTHVSSRRTVLEFLAKECGVG